MVTTENFDWVGLKQAVIDEITILVRSHRAEHNDEIYGIAGPASPHKI
ncbi:hypothetical protein GII33_07535 [Gordonia pseudamarae]|jgi:hypothetical protein|nr:MULTISPECIES: hypothetical protein [Gordonia]QHN25836.1 hypothetical protein GII33_07535 [Gordonia pseudamarae]